MKGHFMLSLAGVVLLLPIVLGQTAGQTDLPPAPSASQQQSKPKAQAAPAQQAPAPPAAAKAQPEPVPAASESSKADAGSVSRTDAASTQQEETAATIRSTVNEVNVVFTVTDKHGRYVKDLKRSDFEV